MQLRNLEQLRAIHALKASKSEQKNYVGINNGEVVKKVPTMIRENGFLEALAFAIEKEAGYDSVFIAIMQHLVKVKKLTVGELEECKEQKPCEKFMAVLCKGDSSRLQVITAESMAYLNYLRRFVKPEKKD